MQTSHDLFLNNKRDKGKKTVSYWKALPNQIIKFIINLNIF